MELKVYHGIESNDFEYFKNFIHFNRLNLSYFY